MAIENSGESYILKKFKSINTFVFDMDGVLTDGTLLIMESSPISEHPNWFRKMHVRDGYALQLAAGLGYNIVVISGSSAPPVEDRLKRLKINHVFFNVREKKSFLTDIFKENKWTFQSALYMGDDIPDIEAMDLCSLKTCPADAVSEIKIVADYVSPYKGGEGCVRDVISKVLKLQNKWHGQTEIPST